MILEPPVKFGQGAFFSTFLLDRVYLSSGIVAQACILNWALHRLGRSRRYLRPKPQILKDRNLVISTLGSASVNIFPSSALLTDSSGHTLTSYKGFMLPGIPDSSSGRYHRVSCKHPTRELHARTSRLTETLFCISGPSYHTLENP